MEADFNLRSSLWDHRDLFTDIGLVCGQGPSRQVIRGHKIILASSSPYFAKMCLKPLDEISLPDDEYLAVRTLLKFIYTGQTPESEQEFEDFVQVGKKLSVRGLPNSGPQPKVDGKLSSKQQEEASSEESGRNRKRRREDEVQIDISFRHYTQGWVALSNR